MPSAATSEALATLSEAHASQLAYIKLAAPAALYAPPLAIADQSCEAQDIARWVDDSEPAAAESPIFIVGFPRSGTTLLELVLDAHPQLTSIDEQPFLQNALDDILTEKVRYPGELATLTQAQLERIRGAYWAKTARRVERAPGERLIDKNPLNVFRLPVIKRLFPNAKIIFAIRHPCDVILSCFMQHFRAPDFALLCQDIPTLAAAYRRTFDFWYAQQELLQADVLELRYERLVDDFEPNVRRVFDFLELPWDPAVLSPAKRAQQKQFISTPSYSQVIQPINARSIGRWRNYQDALHGESADIDALPGALELFDLRAPMHRPLESLDRPGVAVRLTAPRGGSHRAALLRGPRRRGSRSRGARRSPRSRHAIQQSDPPGRSAAAGPPPGAGACSALPR